MRYDSGERFPCIFLYRRLNLVENKNIILGNKRGMFLKLLKNSNCSGKLYNVESSFEYPYLY